MRQADRLSAILEDLSEGSTVGVSDLCGRLGVSAATIRRDLELLERQRLLTRTHGGAVAQGVLYELPLRYKSARRQAEKRRIAAAAAERVADGAAIGLSGGTTTSEVARAIVDRPRLTVVTNALNIASAHRPGADRPASRVICVTDSSKIGRNAFAQICPIERVDESITDVEADRSVLAALVEAGVAVTAV